MYESPQCFGDFVYKVAILTQGIRGELVVLDGLDIAEVPWRWEASFQFRPALSEFALVFSIRHFSFSSVGILLSRKAIWHTI